MKRLFISVYIKIYQILLYFFCLSLLFPSSAITEPIHSITAEVTTADVRWAGTDNAVHLVLRGPNVKDWKLNNPGNDFERGDTNTFRLTSNLPNDTCDIRGMISISKSPDHWYDSGGWRLAGLRVYYNNDQSNLIYQNNNINKWLEDDNREWSDTFDTENICCFTINPVQLFAPYTKETGYTVSVMTSDSSCTWTANKSPDDPEWITITGGSSGTGNGTVTFDVAANKDSARSATITIAGQSFTVTQGDRKIVQQITLASAIVLPGAPIWVKTTFTNNSNNDIYTIKPDCYNTYFWVTDSSGNMVVPWDLIGPPYGIPDDVVYIPAHSSYPPSGPLSCDISDRYPDLAPDNYNVIATYANYFKDPDYDPVTKQCSDPDRKQCYDLWTGAAGSGRSTITVSAIEVVGVRSPNGGEILQSGSTWLVKWHTNKTIKPMAKTILEYTTDGTTWKSIKTLSGNPGIYSWTVPNVSSSRCKVKVVLKAADSTTEGSDVSDKFFTIQPYKVKH